MPDPRNADDIRKMLLGDRTDAELDAQVTAHYAAESYKQLQKLDARLERVQSVLQKLFVPVWVAAGALLFIGYKLWLG